MRRRVPRCIVSTSMMPVQLADLVPRLERRGTHASLDGETANRRDTDRRLSSMAGDDSCVDGAVLLSPAVQTSLPADGDLPAGQELVTEDEPTGRILQRPATYPCAPELLNPHGERRGPRMATWNGEELAGDVQHDVRAHH